MPPTTLSPARSPHIWCCRNHSQLQATFLNASYALWEVLTYLCVSTSQGDERCGWPPPALRFTADSPLASALVTQLTFFSLSALLRAVTSPPLPRSRQRGSILVHGVLYRALVAHQYKGPSLQRPRLSRRWRLSALRLHCQSPYGADPERQPTSTEAAATPDVRGGLTISREVDGTETPEQCQSSSNCPPTITQVGVSKRAQPP